MKKENRQRKRTKYASLHQMPGQVTYVGNKPETDTVLEITNYRGNQYEKKDAQRVEDAFAYKANSNVTWININGLHDTAEIEKLGSYYGLHPLVIEDIVNTRQRPKIDEYEDYLFVVLKMLYYNQADELVNEHLSIVLGANYVLTFQEAGGDVFDDLRKRLKAGQGKIRNVQPDYLMYALIDAVIDHYFLIIENVGDTVEALEEKLFISQPEKNITYEIQDLKKQIIKLRKIIYPLKEVTGRIEKSTHPLIEKRTKNYLQDLHDHIIQVAENIEVYREMSWSLMDMYITTISNKMNEVMKVLTIMASIFIPLTFMAGIYGMNFDYMPELHYKYAYYWLWAAMIVVSLAMLWYFKRKKWL